MSSKSQAVSLEAKPIWSLSDTLLLGTPPNPTLIPIEPAVKPEKSVKTPLSIHSVALILKGIAAQEKALDEEIEQIQAQIEALEGKIGAVEFRKRNLYKPFYDTVQQVSKRLHELSGTLEYVDLPYSSGIDPDEDWSTLGRVEFFTNVRLDNPRKKFPMITMDTEYIDRWGDTEILDPVEFDANIFTPEGLAKFKKECDEAVAENKKVKQKALEEEREKEERRREQERIRAEDCKQREAAQKEREKKEAAQRTEKEREKERKEYERLRKKFEVPVSLF